MADRKHLLHVKSNVAEEAKQYGIDKFLVTPKKPVDSTTGKATDDTLLYGEIAVNYGKGVEALIIRNQENNVVAFVNENDFYEAGKIASDGLATEKMEREQSIAAEAVAREQADISEANERAQAIDAEASAREQAFNYLDTKIDTSAVLSMVSITYAEMKELRDQSKLKAGQLYRITDYVTTTMQANTQSAGHVFDVIVLATDADTLNENAKVIKHEGDTYFANSDLDAWEIKYDLDNDTVKYAWADETNGKGVIFYMKDEWNNECPYDFKNIQFKRWTVTDVRNSKLDSDTLKSLQDIFLYDGDDTKFITRYAYQDSEYTYGDTTYVVNSNESDWYYTFSTFKFHEKDGKEVYALTDIEDASIKGNRFHINQGGCGCCGNSIKPYYNYMASDSGYIDGSQYLNNIVFNGYYQITAEGSSYHCFGNSIGYNSYNNTFGNNCQNNTFGNYCSNNTFGNKCYSNTFGLSGNNTFGNGCSNNIFGKNGNNTFGKNCRDNTFGNDCSGNTFGNMCDNNTFGNNCQSNTFVSNCIQNTFGNNCNHNSFIKDCIQNTFGNTIENVKFEKNYMHYITIEDGNRYITVTSTQTTGAEALLRNFTIAQGVNNGIDESQRKTISHDTTNDTFKTTYQNANSKTVDV